MTFKKIEKRFGNRRMKNLLRSKRVRQGILVLIDLAIVAVCTWLSLAMRFSLNSIPPEYIALAFKSLPIDMVITVAVFWIFKLYHSVWSFASINEVIGYSKRSLLLFYWK